MSKNTSAPRPITNGEILDRIYKRLPHVDWDTANFINQRLGSRRKFTLNEADAAVREFTGRPFQEGAR